MDQKQSGSKAYLFSIVLVAVLGGLLFGYDTAVISGAEKGLQAFFLGAEDFTYTDGWHGFTCASALIGCIIGSAISGYLASNWGRKKSLIFAGIMFFISALGSMEPEFLFFEHGHADFPLLIAFNIYRVIGGVGVGLASAICPMYIAEVAPSNIRGTLVSWNQFAIIFGQLVVYMVNFLILGDHTNPVIESIGQGMSAVMPGSDPWTIATGWRYMFGSEAVPAGLFAILICFVPETPRYLVMAGQDSKALAVLSKINGDAAGRTILDEIKNTITEKTERVFTYGVLVIFVGIMLSVFQQAVGINAVLYYAPRIFGDMGMENPMMQTIIMGVVNILFTLVAIFTVEKWGRKPLLITGSTGMAVGAFGVALTFGHAGLGVCHDAQHHGLQRVVHDVVGPDLLGAHLRNLPQHHPRSGRCDSRRLPMDFQLDCKCVVRAHVQHAGSAPTQTSATGSLTVSTALSACSRQYSYGDSCPRPRARRSKT